MKIRKQNTGDHEPFVRRKANRGFTLVEVMVTLALISCGLIMVIGGMRKTMRAASHASSYYAALRIVEEKLFAVKTHSMINEPENQDIYVCTEERSLQDGSNIENVDICVRWKNKDRENTVCIETSAEILR